MLTTPARQQNNRKHIIRSGELVVTDDPTGRGIICNYCHMLCVMHVLNDRIISPNVVNILDKAKEKERAHVSVSCFVRLNLSFTLIGDLAISTISQRGMYTGFK